MAPAGSSSGADHGCDSHAVGVAHVRRRSTTDVPSGVLAAQRMLSNAVGAFRTAVELDQANDDAKVNLELALRAYAPILFPSNAPDAGGARGQESGQGRSGSGY